MGVALNCHGMEKWTELQAGNDHSISTDTEIPDFHSRPIWLVYTTLASKLQAIVLQKIVPRIPVDIFAIPTYQ